MNLQAKETLDQAIADSCLKLFSDYRLEIRARQPSDRLSTEHFLLCGIIGFTAKDMRGALVLAATREPLDRTNRTRARTTHRDWICELSNQLLGRVKNQMLPRGLELHAATPVSIRGDHLQPIFAQTPVAEIFLAEVGVVAVWLDCEFDETFAWPPPYERVEAPVSEGEMLLF